MSVIDKLNEVQRLRQSKYSKALRKSPTEQASAYLAEPNEVKTPLRAVKSQSWMFKGILALLVVLILAVGLVIVLLLKSSSAAKKVAKPPASSSQTAGVKAKAKPKAKSVSTSATRKTSQ